MIGALCLAYLAGPLNSPEWRAGVTSLTAKNAKELWLLMRQTAEISGLADTSGKCAGPVIFQKTPTPGVAIGQNGAQVDFWAADEGTGHSTGLDLAIVDDAGLLGERDRDLWDAMFSATSGRDGRMISMSILARGPMFAELRARKDEPAVFWQEFCPSPGSEKHIQDESVWHAANPGLRSGIKSLSYMRDAAARAAMNPAGLPNFLAYDLNLPQEPGREMILTPAQWQMCVVESPPERAGPVALGLDIGGSTSMTACVAYWPQVGRLEAWGAFPAEPDLQTRGLKDGTGQVYLRMEARDELRTYPGLVTPVGEFLRDVKTRLAGQRILSIGADRYRKAEVTQAFTEAGIAWAVEWRGTGHSATADGSADVRAFQDEVLEKRVKTAESMLLANAIAESAIRRDDAGNPALDKGRSRGRIDALQAGVIALGIGRRWRPSKRKRGWRSLGIIGEAA